MRDAKVQINLLEGKSNPRNAWLWGVLAALATPFAVTGIYRLLPESATTWLWTLAPFVALGLVALALWITPAVPRSVSVGIGVGLVAWGLFLAWLIGMMASTPFP